MRVLNALKHYTDWIHIILGMLTKVLVIFSPLLSLLILLTFIVYEALQRESKSESYFDLIEFLVGYIIGDIALSLLRAFILPRIALTSFLRQYQAGTTAFLSTLTSLASSATTGHREVVWSISS